MNEHYTFEEHLAEVLSRYGDTPDPRLKEIMEALTRHLLSFAHEVKLSRDEWMKGLQFLTATGQKSDDKRLEMMLLSDLLGLSALIDIMEYGGEIAESELAPTDGTLLGPFYFPNAPERAFGDTTIEVDDPSERLRVHGTVMTTEGKAIPNATIEIWQNGHDGLYTVQALDRFPMEHLRGTYRSRDDGEFEILCLRPVDYPVPMDGPPGDMLRATEREGMRAAHLHFLVTADGFKPLVTELFDTQSVRLHSDVVFGVRPSLLRTPTPGADGILETTFDLVLQPA
ncbi:MAG: 6-chlorohydroxyquinol-1,2-dioxygenase [Actinobacteria bacterium]|nr:6-chlorohydroxyquinol-1,2-dioxygenase [Actinomycetota bacterium]